MTSGALPVLDAGEGERLDDRRIAAAGATLTGADGSIAKLATSRICQRLPRIVVRIVGAPLLLAGADSPMGGDLQNVNLSARERASAGGPTRSSST